MVLSDGPEARLTLAFPGVKGVAPSIREALRLLMLVAPADTTVLLLGETGTGKELAARALHGLSPRAHRPLMAVNCAALPEPLLESELFGHEKGAFTGAVSRKEGRFPAANLGTVFLDEVGELALPTQAKILRVLQSREFEPLGSNRTVKVDVRIIAATNRDLAQEVRAGRFREDLFYRLNVFPITLPPLRERREDLPLLAAFFLERHREKHGKAVASWAPEVMAAFRCYPWPGNIRELENILERAVILCPGETLTLRELPPVFQELVFPSGAAAAEPPAWPELERELISRTLEKAAGDRSRAGDILGISRAELDLKIRTYGLDC